MWRPNSGRTVWLSVALLIIRTGTAKVSFLPSFLGDLCQRDNPCVDEARCVIDPAAPVVGRPFCICPSGYEGDGRADGEGCEDVDECALSTDTCVLGAERCENTPGSYRCECLDGYEKTRPFGHCHDIDECRSPNVCRGSDVSCHNLPGSYACVCHNEYKEWTADGCKMRDVCEGNGGIFNPCDFDNGLCVNTLEGPQCFCNKGFKLSSDGHTCEDVDECELGVHKCPESISHCHNTPGSYRCDCDEGLGYANEGPYSCENLNECEKYTDVCSDPRFFCCMDLPPPQKFICAPPLAAFVDSAQNQASRSGHPLGGVHLVTSREQVLPHDDERFSETLMTPTPPLVLTDETAEEGLREPIVEWFADGVRLMKNKQRDMFYIPTSIIEQWTPPAISQLKTKVGSTMKRIFNGDYNHQEESHLMGRRLEADSGQGLYMATDVAERAAKRVAEAAMSIVPSVIPPVFTRHTQAQCPAGFINLNAARQRAVIERVPEAAGQVVGFMKQFLPMQYGGKLDPTAVAVGMATNANSLANSLSSWYKAFVALPEALQGATANITGINVKDDIEGLIATGTNAAQPVLDLIGNVANAAQNSPLRGADSLRGSGPILAPIANL